MRNFAFVTTQFAMLAVFGTALPSARAKTVRAISLQAPTQLDLRSGEELVMRGAVVTAVDNTVFDAATHSELVGGQREVRPGGLIELEGTGLALTAQDPKTHEVRLVATGAAAPKCVAVGAAGPCIVPRLQALAHERLMTETELLVTLNGELQATAPSVVVPAVKDALVPAAKVLGILALGGGLVVLLAFAIAALLWRWQSPLHALSRQAKRTRDVFAKRRDYASMVPHVQALETKAHAIYKQLSLVRSRLGDNSLAGRAAQATLQEEYRRLQKAATDLQETLALLESKALVADAGAEAHAAADISRATDELAVLEQANQEAEAVLRREGL
jgi:hypothetical protein